MIKKVDSTMRGNIAAEIKAVDEHFKPELMIFAPALPDLKRTTIDGVQCLNLSLIHILPLKNLPLLSDKTLYPLFRTEYHA